MAKIKVSPVSTGARLKVSGLQKSLELLLYLRGEGKAGTETAKTFTANDFWYSCIPSTGDLMEIMSFGCRFVRYSHLDTGYGVIVSEPEKYKYEFVGLYTDKAGTVSAGEDKANFFIDRVLPSLEPTATQKCVSVESINAFDTPCYTWRLKIIERAQYKAFSRSSAHQDINKSLPANNTSHIYAGGSDAILLADARYNYYLVDIYAASGAKVSKTNISRIVQSSGTLDIKNDSDSAISWCYLTYTRELKK